MVVQRADIRRVEGPFIFTNEFTAVGSNLVFSQLCRVCRRAVVMVSVDVCFTEKGRLHFIADKAKVNAKLYVETL